MSKKSADALDLPLLWWTPPEWADFVLTRPLDLLNDHAHLEKKAATNALELLTRWPERIPPQHWGQAMTAIARDEVRHLAAVYRLLTRRGGRFTKHHRNPYASQLRDFVRQGKGLAELADRLMVSALIEARSCERFHLLASHCQDRPLAKLYDDLFASEAGHYRVFLELARGIPGVKEIESRWREFLDFEVQTIREQPPSASMHGGIP